MTFNQNKERIEKSVKFGEIEGLEFLKDKVRLGRKKPIDYMEMKEEEQNEVKQSKHDEARELLIRAIEYNIKNGRKTKIKIGKNDNLKEVFKNLSEEDLYEVETLLCFAHDPINDDPNKRMIVTVPDHQKMTYIIAILKKQIPGFAEQLAINKLKNELTLGEKKIKELEKERDQKRLEHKSKIETQGLVQMPKLSEEKHICDHCGKDFKSAGGKGSHMKTCDKNPNKSK